MDLNGLKERIQNLLKDDTSPEDAQEIGAILQEVDSIEKERTELVQSQEQLRRKYIESLKQSSFGEEPKPAVDDSHEVSFEECVANVIQERK